MKKLLSLTLVSLVLSGCVSFTETQLVRDLPNDIANRNNIIPTAEWKYELAQLAGSVLVERETPVDGSKYYFSKRIIKASTEPEAKAIPEGVLIELITDNKADAKLKLLAAGGVDISGEQKIEFRYIDSARVFIKYEDIDLPSVIAEANKSAGPNVKNRWYVQGALLSVTQRKVFTKVQGVLQKTVSGSGFEADSDIYSSNSKATKDYAIHLTLRRLDDFKDGDPSRLKGLLSTPPSQDTSYGLWVTTGIPFASK